MEAHIHVRYTLWKSGTPEQWSWRDSMVDSAGLPATGLTAVLIDGEAGNLAGGPETVIIRQANERYSVLAAPGEYLSEIRSEMRGDECDV
jgi:hypothetical protein